MIHSPASKCNSIVSRSLLLSDPQDPTAGYGASKMIDRRHRKGEAALELIWQLGMFEGTKPSLELPMTAGNLKCWMGNVVIKEQTHFTLNQYPQTYKVGF